MQDWKLPTEELIKLPRPRVITALTNGLIEEFGRKEGPKRVCLHIQSLLVGHINKPNYADYIADAAQWSDTLDKVCKKRRIRFNATITVVEMLHWKGEKVARKVIKQMELVLRESGEDRAKAFAERIGPLSDADELRARGMGIRWDKD